MHWNTKSKLGRVRARCESRRLRTKNVFMPTRCFLTLFLERIVAVVRHTTKLIEGVQRRPGLFLWGEHAYRQGSADWRQG